MWLAIEGIIGAGKTTTAELISARGGLQGVLERSADHPFLEAYYRDPQRYAIETEIMFMLLQVHQLRDLNPISSWVSDFSLAKNLIFARMNCTGADLKFLESIDERLRADFEPPDLVVFLDVPAEVCLSRIGRRGRGYEQGIRMNDLAQLRVAYLSSLETLGVTVKSLALDGGESPAAVASAVTALAELG
jgi:deoxyguanosine kinase